MENKEVKAGNCSIEGSTETNNGIVINPLEYHYRSAIKDSYIGCVQYWEFLNMFIFLNYEKGRAEVFRNPEQVKFISDEYLQKLYVERNKHEGNEDEMMLGKVVAGHQKVVDCGTTKKSGKWSKLFCKEVAILKAEIEFYKEMKSLGFSKRNVDEHDDIFSKHYLHNDSTYYEYCKKMCEEELSNEEILTIIDEYYNIPYKWDTKRKPRSKEMDFYARNK